MNNQLIAFLAGIIAITLLMLTMILTSAFAHLQADVVVAFGVGTAVGAIAGVLKMDGLNNQGGQ